MATQDPRFEAVLSLVKQLTPGQKLRLIEAIVPDLEEPLQRAEDGELVEEASAGSLAGR